LRELIKTTGCIGWINAGSDPKNHHVEGRMNIHHLELFYYVARHGGIMEAVRNMPYGIQQPAVSSQIRQLEEHLGVTLFVRRPFSLTSAGHELYGFIQPFFDNLGTVADKLRGGMIKPMIIGASDIILRDYLPRPLACVRQKHPQLKINLRVGHHPELEAWVQEGIIDVAVTVLDPKPPPGLHSIAMLEIPPVLLVPTSSRWRSAQQLWDLDVIEETFITLPSQEKMCRKFQQYLAAKGIDWFPGIEVGSLDIIEKYVMSGYGIGLGLKVPKRKLPEEIRLLELDDLEPIQLGPMWRGYPSPVMESFFGELKGLAKHLMM
jgi:DNA-binding transcriptional LysR family regulator